MQLNDIDWGDLISTGVKAVKANQQAKADKAARAKALADQAAMQRAMMTAKPAGGFALPGGLSMPVVAGIAAIAAWFFLRK